MYMGKYIRRNASKHPNEAIDNMIKLDILNTNKSSFRPYKVVSVNLKMIQNVELIDLGHMDCLLQSAHSSSFGD